MRSACYRRRDVLYDILGEPRSAGDGTCMSRMSEYVRRYEVQSCRRAARRERRHRDHLEAARAPVDCDDGAVPCFSVFLANNLCPCSARMFSPMFSLFTN